MTPASVAAPLRVLLANRSRLDREGLAALIRQTDATISVAGMESAQHAFDALSGQGAADALVITVTPCSNEDLGCIGDSLKRKPAIPVVLVMNSVAPPVAANLTELGIKGIVLSSASAEVLVAAIRMAAGGNTYLPPELLHGRAHAESGAPALDSLTQREIKIMALLGEGLSNKEIARRLDAKEATIKVQIHRLMRKLGVANRTQAAVLASRHDMVHAQALDRAG
ncbi:MAG TPA: response regulator transcription factor [Alphaproteobacteria bacterium]|nr:response regulator transcription factor [Alphaproteobacteria bacterium]